ncbi:MAG: hypothetical protein ACOYW3_09795 [Bacteroidota bacterium]
MKSFKIWIVIFLAAATGHAQIGAKAQQSSLAGVWQNSQFNFQMTLLLNADGSGEFDGDAITYTTQGNQLRMTQNGEVTSYNFVLQGNSLSLSGGDIDGTIVFTRNGQSAAPTPKAAAKQNTASGELIGVWSGNGETIEFKTNGQCVYLGNTFPFSASDGILTLTTGQGAVQFGYAIASEQLTLSANGREVVYHKGANRSNSPGGQTGRGNVSTELVGKWCWTNVTSSNSGGSSSSSCIVLNADGTYEYSSESSRSVNTDSFSGGTASQGYDRGTWSVNGDRIFYNSATRGQGSYQLQKVNHPKTGDPMIVLDGEPYVTFFQKAPWR